MVDFERLARPGVRDLRAYDPGHDLVALRRRFAEAQLVELGSNENPYGASPQAREAIHGMPASEWKATRQTEATPEQLARMEESVRKNAPVD